MAAVNRAKPRMPVAAKGPLARLLEACQEALARDDAKQFTMAEIARCGVTPVTIYRNISTGERTPAQRQDHR